MAAWQSVYSGGGSMNKRIQELAEQAGLFDVVIESMGIDEEMQKFAELIVRECMSIIKQGEGLGEEDDFDKGFQAGIAMAYNRVRTQMGVES
jgi:hypothetical protein